jgi:glycosyltransferase involved in cell wall biosynthesis
MRNLFVTTHTPIVSSGRAVRTYGIARALAAHGGLDLLYRRFEGDRPDAAFSAIANLEMHEVSTRRTPARLLAYAGARRKGVPSPLARGVSPELRDAAASLAARPGRGLIVADGPVAAASLASLAARRGVIYNAHNFESGFRNEPGMNEKASPRELQAFERGVLEGAAESWMVSHADIAAAHELCPSAKLRYVPNVVDVRAIAPVDLRPEHHRAVFVANFSYPPNQSGLRFMVNEVMPRLWEQVPDAKLSLVGGNPPDIGGGDPRVERHGFVSELHTVYAEASCAVVPLLLGGGTPLKLVEALAFGLPVVATPRAGAGLELRDGEQCLLADGADAFAHAIARTMLEGGEPEIARRGRELAEREYSIETLERVLADVQPESGGMSTVA